jgi:predicted negative regulator of RcsB-dependent stress response
MEASMDGKSLLIGVLLIGVGVFGYLYWDSHYNTVFKAPGVEIKKN